MKSPCLHNRLFVFVAFAATCGFVSFSTAQPTPAVASSQAESKNARAPRVKPQVIYHLPPASTYAAALHSQAKTKRDVLPIDSSMPTSFQMSRAAANEAAAKAQQEQAVPPGPAKESANSAQAVSPRAVKRRLPSQRPVVRGHSPGKAHGPGNPHGNKSRRK